MVELINFQDFFGSLQNLKDLTKFEEGHRANLNNHGNGVLVAEPVEKTSKSACCTNFHLVGTIRMALVNICPGETYL